MSWNNQVILVGSLGADCETRHSATGSPVVNFRMATSKKWKDRGGSDKEETQWHNVVVFGDKAAEYAPHLTKGTFVRVEGELAHETWEQDGQKRHTTKIRANHIGPGGFPRANQSAPTNGHTQTPLPPTWTQTPAPPPDIDDMPY